MPRQKPERSSELAFGDRSLHRNRWRIDCAWPTIAYPFSELLRPRVVPPNKEASTSTKMGKWSIVEKPPFAAMAHGSFPTGMERIWTHARSNDIMRASRELDLSTISTPKACSRSIHIGHLEELYSTLEGRLQRYCIIDQNLFTIWMNPYCRPS